MLAALAEGTIANNEKAVTKPTKVNRAIVTLLMKKPGPGPGTTTPLTSLGA
jgi:hypothetical protein